MPALPVEAADTARAIAFNLVSRATPYRTPGSRSSGVGSAARVVGGGIIAAIVVGVVVFVAVVVLAVCLYRRHKNQSSIRKKETQKYFGSDDRSSIGTDGTAPSQGHGNNYNYRNGAAAAAAAAGTNGNPHGGYNYGQGYGYAHHASPGQYGYGSSHNIGGISGAPPALTTDHIGTAK